MSKSSSSRSVWSLVLKIVITETTVQDMILSASLRRKGLSFRRGTAMNDNQSDGTHRATYSSVLRSSLR